MRAKPKGVRKSVTLPAKLATEVRSLARRHRLSSSRMMAELLEEGVAARRQKESSFMDLGKRLRAAEDPEEIQRLGDQFGQMIFGR